MDAMDIQAVESKLSDVTVTPIPMTSIRGGISNNSSNNNNNNNNNNSNTNSSSTSTATISSASSASSNLTPNQITSALIQQYQQQLPQIQIQAQPAPHQSTSASQLALPPQPISPLIITTQTSANITTPMTSAANIPSNLNNLQGLSKYAQLLAVIEEMGRDIRPTYTGSRSSTERLKRGIVHARILVRECLLETERSARQ